ncbi:MAG: hypothetical protein MUC88_13070 [Planctomycetes bacterium]|jgi:uncharacterized protein (DUF427 family)|nr:hypothetical protein [Planctomycetota bacterium]
MEGKRISVEEVKQAMRADFDRLAEAVAQAMNAAHDGHIIADTEERVHEANAVFREQGYEKVIRLLQIKQEAFSPSAGRTAEPRRAGDHPPDGQRTRVGA